MTRILPRTHQAPPPDSVLRQLRIPFVRRASLLRGDAEEEVFVIDIGLAGVFVERARPLDQPERIRRPRAFDGSAGSS